MDGNGNGLIVQNNRLANSGGYGPGCHGNVFYLGGNNTGMDIFRYNDVSQWDDAGIFVSPYPDSGSTGANHWKVYGNVFHDAHVNTHAQNYPCGICFRYAGDGYDFHGNDWEVYNNTFANIVGAGGGDGIRSYNGQATCSPNCFIRDNIATNSGINSIGTQSNNTTSASYVNAGAQNYHLASATPAGYALSSSLPTGCTVGTNCYNIDMDGKTRGADGVWDIGAYEYGTVSSGNPAAPTGLVASVQ